MKRLRHLLPLVSLVLLVRCSSTTNPVAGGSTTTENEKTVVAGHAAYGDGPAAACARVSLRSRNYLALDDTTAHSRYPLYETESDSNGGFTLRGVKPGQYTLEINDERTAAAAFPVDVFETDDTITVGRQVLTPYASLQGVATVAGTTTPLRASVYVLGRIALVDTVHDTYRFDNLPAGAWKVRIHSGDRTVGAAVASTDSIPPGQHRTLDTLALVQFTDERYGDWAYQRDIAINTTTRGGYIAQDVHQFPLLLALQRDNFPFAQSHPDGYDIRFSKENGIPLRYEIEYWDTQEQQAAVWVLMDTVRASDSTQSITMHWGNPQAPDFSNGKAVFDTANGFVAVFHMNRGVLGGEEILIDATAHKLHGRATGPDLPAPLPLGQVGYAADFDGDDDGFTIENTQPIDIATFSGWLYITDFGQDRIFSRAGQRLFLSAGHFHLQMTRNEPLYRWNFGAGLSIVNRFAFCLLSIPGNFAVTTPRMFLDGNPMETGTGTTSTNAYTADTKVTFGLEGVYPFSGNMDEIRISRVVRSPSWQKLCYENQRREQTLLRITP